MLVEGGHARGVRLAGGGELSAGTVVNCLGPWFQRLNATAGVETKTRISPVRIQVRADCGTKAGERREGERERD
jgi:glycine/D-amino acid oxidase-like deaminating enzyme